MKVDGFVVLISLRIIKPVMERDGLLRLFCFRKFYCCMIWGKKMAKNVFLFFPTIYVIVFAMGVLLMCS